MVKLSVYIMTLNCHDPCCRSIPSVCVDVSLSGIMWCAERIIYEYSHTLSRMLDNNRRTSRTLVFYPKTCYKYIVLDVNKPNYCMSQRVWFLRDILASQMLYGGFSLHLFVNFCFCCLSLWSLVLCWTWQPGWQMPIIPRGAALAQHLLQAKLPSCYLTTLLRLLHQTFFIWWEALTE